MVRSKEAHKAASKKRRTANKAENLANKKRRNWYSVTDAKKRVTRKCKTPRSAKLRSDITPGTVLILLSGRFRGRRVVFLKQLPSGLLLVTGPYKYNGVPLKRVNQAYVLATATKVKLGNVPSLDKLNDDFFKAVKSTERTNLGEVVMKNDQDKKARVTQTRRDTQNMVDTEVKKVVDQTPYLKDYLRHRFGLKSGQQFHNLNL